MAHLSSWISGNCKFAQSDKWAANAAEAIRTAFNKAHGQAAEMCGIKVAVGSGTLKIAANGEFTVPSTLTPQPGTQAPSQPKFVGKTLNLIDIALDFLKESPAWQNVVARAKALKSFGQARPQDLAALIAPLRGAMDEVSKAYGLDRAEVERKLIGLLGLDEHRPSALAPGGLPAR